MREAVLAALEEQNKPLDASAIEASLALSDADSFKALVKLLVQLEEEGAIVRTRANKYALPNQFDMQKGTLSVNSKGFGFVRIGEGIDDIYVSASELNGAMQGDTVLVKIKERSTGARQEGTIVRVVERGQTDIVGTFHLEKGYAFVRPDDTKISNDFLVPPGEYGGAVDGHKVVLHITRYPAGRESGEGEIIHIIGHKNDPGVDILSIIHKHNIPTEFPADALAQANAVPDEIAEADIAGRRDFRNETIVTIDGADAKDLDDAVHVKVLPNGHYELGVHIADVTHYVTEGSPIDVEARDRGTSVYLVDRVIPMIPHRLSNGICSLNPRVDRLTISCIMEMDATGKV
ncbi:MAG: ribonuclease R family protein, partial [Bacilli bacterium]